MTKLPEPPNDDEFNEYNEEGSGADDFTPLGGCILIDYHSQPPIPNILNANAFISRKKIVTTML